MRHFAIFGLIFSVGLAHAIEPNPPEAWLSNPEAPNSGVYVFTPSDSAIEVTEVLEELTSNQGAFGAERYAIFFQPGDYDSDLVVNVGAYTSVMGLGENPSDTALFSINCLANDAPRTSWHSLENVATSQDIRWSGSQACPLRRVHIDGNLSLSEGTPLSGGFLADSVITGNIDAGMQRQYLFRNCEMGSFDGGLWNLVFVGCQGSPETTCVTCKDPSRVTRSLTSVSSTPLIAEKPYITCIDGEYSLSIPQLQLSKQGSSHSDAIDLLDFSHVYVSDPLDGVDQLNEKIQDPDVEAIILSPSIYPLEGTLVINKENFVLLGIGFPTLIAGSSGPCISVTADNVRVGGVILQAGAQELETKALLTWEGSETAGFLYDCFARCGRFDENDPTFNAVSTFMQIDSSHVVCDNVWLWRADCDAIDSAVSNGDNPVNQALIVNGNNVTVYGLAVEHTLQDLVQWFGKSGQCYFFQAELPCDATHSYVTPNAYVAYRLGNEAAPHQGFGLSISSNFYNPQITVQNGIKTPLDTRIEFTNPMTCYLGHYGGIKSVINGQGLSVNSLQTGPYPLHQFVSKTNPVNSHRKRR